MGTRSLTVFLEDRGTEIVVMYRQYDGYPTGHGSELKKFLMRFDSGELGANGMGCLAAQVVRNFKDGIGNIYLYAAGSRNCGEEYIYTLYRKENAYCLKLQAGCVTYFGLPGTEENNMPILYDGPIAAFDPHQTETEWWRRSEDPPNDFLEKTVQNTS